MKIKGYVPELKRKFKEEVVPEMMKKFGYKNPLQVPTLHKIVINMAVGEAVNDPSQLEAAVNELTWIAGQRPVVIKAKKSVAAFKLRKGMPIAAKVTLRGNLMWDFFYKLVNIALPRVRDFQGVDPDSFDGRGNYSLGISEQLVFPELDHDKIKGIRGMDINIVTTAKTDEEARELLRLLGMPFRRSS